MATKLPKWLNIDLYKDMLAEVEDHPSYKNYINNVPIQQSFYHGTADGLQGLFFPKEQFGDDMELPEEWLVARYNKIKENVNKTGSVFMKNNPIVRRWPITQAVSVKEGAEWADAMDSLWLDAWEHSSGQFVMRNMLQEAQITGLSIGKVLWNHHDRSRGRNGELCVRKLTPGAIKFDPLCSNAHRGTDARYIIHSTRQKPGYLVYKFGTEVEKALGIRSGSGRSKKFSFATMLNTGKTVIKKLKDPKTPEEKVDDRVQVDEVWIFPKTMYESDLVGGDVLKADEYPHGCVVTIVNDEIVDVMRNPAVKTKVITEIDEFNLPKQRRVQVGHARHPFVPLYWARTADLAGEGHYNFYDCSSQVMAQIALQVSIDRLRRDVHIGASVAAAPVLGVQEDAVVNDMRNFTWTPTQILRIREGFNANEAIQILQGQAMPQYVYDMIMTDIAAIEKSAGIEPGMVGLFPQGGGTSHTPGITIGALQESAFGPLWVYVMELAVALLDMSVLYDGLIQLKYKPHMYAAVIGNEQKFVDWQDKHITANFNRKVVAAATTPLFDIDKATHTANVVEIVKEAVTNANMTQNPVYIQVAIAQIDALNYPWAEQFKQILQGELERMQAMQQGFMQAGTMALQGMAGGDDIAAALAERTGRSPEEIMMALGQ